MDIEVGAEVRSCLEDPAQRIMLHHEASAGVDQNGIMFQTSEQSLADEASIGASPVDVNRQHVRFGKECFNRDHPGPLALIFGNRFKIVGDGLKTERFREARDGRARDEPLEGADAVRDD